MFPPGFDSDDDDLEVQWLHDIPVNLVGNVHFDFDDFDFDDDDFDNEDYENELFGSDFSDSDMSDGSHWSNDVDFSQVFSSLQDSCAVLSQIEYRGDTSKLPRINVDKPESYESTHQVLLELEILLRAWHRRCDHPYTAHLKSDTEPEGAAGPENLDMTYDDEDTCEDLIPSWHTQLVNESLTKKKFCQSTKIFRKIFRSDEEFHETCSLIRSIRKHIFSIIFPQFLDVLPTEIKRKLPNELWEKIWKFSQRPFSKRFEGNVRATDQKYICLEKARITDLFGAIGNLHMMVLEILFKFPCVLRLPPMLEVEYFHKNGSPMNNYPRFMFMLQKSNLEAQFARFMVLETIPDIALARQNDHLRSLDDTRGSKEDDPTESIDTESVDSVAHNDESFSIKVRDRFWSVDGGNFPFRSARKYRHGAFGGVKDDLSCRVVLPDSDESGLGFYAPSEDVICIFELKTNKVLVEIKLEIYEMLRFLLDTSHDPRYALTKNSFSLISFDEYCDIQKDPLIYRYSWENSGAYEATAEHEPIHLQHSEAQKFTPSLDIKINKFEQLNSVSLLNGREFYLLNVQTKDKRTRIVLFNFERNETVFSRDYDYAHVDGVKKSGALIRTEKCVEFLCLEKNVVLKKISFEELLGNFQSDVSLKWNAKFDCNPARQQFAIFSNHFENFRLFEYGGEEFQVIASGSTFIYSLLPRPKRAVLSNGVIVTVADYELPFVLAQSLTHCRNVPVCDLVALDLKSEKEIIGVPLLRVKVPHFIEADLVPVFNGDRPQLEGRLEDVSFVFADDHQLVVQSNYSKRFLTVDFSLSGRDLAEKEAEESYAKLLQLTRIKEEHVSRRTEKIKKLNALLDKYKNKPLTGTVSSWTYSYGFIDADGESNEIGRIFFHLTAVENRRSVRIRAGIRVRFKVELDEGRSNFRAVWVLADSHPKKNSWRGKFRKRLL